MGHLSSTSRSEIDDVELQSGVQTANGARDPCSSQAFIFKGTFSTPLGVRSETDWTLEADVQPPINGVKRPRLISPGCSLGCSTVCPPETKWVRSASEVQLINQSKGLPRITYQRSLVSGLTLGPKSNKFPFRKIFIRLTARNSTGKRGSLWKNWIASWLSFEVMSKEWLPFPETQVRHHWFAPKLSVIVRPTDLFRVNRYLGSKVRRQIRRKLRPVRGRPEAWWSGKAS